MPPDIPPQYRPQRVTATLQGKSIHVTVDYEHDEAVTEVRYPGNDCTYLIGAHSGRLVRLTLGPKIVRNLTLDNGWRKIQQAIDRLTREQCGPEPQPNEPKCQHYNEIKRQIMKRYATPSRPSQT